MIHQRPTTALEYAPSRERAVIHGSATGELRHGICENMRYDPDRATAGIAIQLHLLQRRGFGFDHNLFAAFTTFATGREQDRQKKCYPDFHSLCRTRKHSHL